MLSIHDIQALSMLATLEFTFTVSHSFPAQEGENGSNLKFKTSENCFRKQRQSLDSECEKTAMMMIYRRE